MTDEQLQQLKASASKCADLHWVHGVDDVEGDRLFIGNGHADFYGLRNTEDVAAFIAAANPQTVLEMIEEVRQARAQREIVGGTAVVCPECNGIGFALSEKTCLHCSGRKYLITSR